MIHILIYCLREKEETKVIGEASQCLALDGTNLWMVCVGCAELILLPEGPESKRYCFGVQDTLGWCLQPFTMSHGEPGKDSTLNYQAFL